jgi:DNA-binding MarR family transcriptional regulator
VTRASRALAEAGERLLEPVRVAVRGDPVGHLVEAHVGVHQRGEAVGVEVRRRREQVVEYHETMVTQPGLQDKDLVLWTQLLAEVFNVQMLERLSREHPDVRYSHGFLIQQLVDGPRPVGEIAANLGVTSQAVSKTVRELERIGYVDRRADPADGRVRRVALTERGRAVLEAGRAVRAELNAELIAELGDEQVIAAAKVLRDALSARGAMSAVAARRVRSAQGLPGEGR